MYAKVRMGTFPMVPTRTFDPKGTQSHLKGTYMHLYPKVRNCVRTACGVSSLEHLPALEPRHCNELCRQRLLTWNVFQGGRLSCFQLLSHGAAICYAVRTAWVPNLETYPGWSAQLFPALEPTSDNENDLLYIDVTSLVRQL